MWVIPTPRRLRQNGHKFKAMPGTKSDLSLKWSKHPPQKNLIVEHSLRRISFVKTVHVCLWIYFFIILREHVYGKQSDSSTRVYNVYWSNQGNNSISWSLLWCGILELLLVTDKIYPSLSCRKLTTSVCVWCHGFLSLCLWNGGDSAVEARRTISQWRKEMFCRVFTSRTQL